MSRIINIPQHKQIKPLLGAYLLKGGRSYEIPLSWHMPKTYTDGTPIDWNFSEEAKAEKPTTSKEGSKDIKDKKPKRSPRKPSKVVKNTTTEAPKDELPKEEDNDAK